MRAGLLCSGLAVILDDAGYISFDVEEAELLFQYVALRYETKSTIITTNLHLFRMDKDIPRQSANNGSTGQNHTQCYHIEHEW